MPELNPFDIAVSTFKNVAAIVDLDKRYHGLAAEKQISMRDAAYAIAIERVAHAMATRGAQ